MNPQFSDGTQQHPPSNSFKADAPGLIIFDINGTIRSHNAAVENLLGLTGTVIDKNISEILPEIGIEPAECSVSAPRAIKTRGGRTLEACITLLHEQEPQVFAAVLLPCCGPERAATTAQDIQKLKLDSIGRLAAGIAHEINTPTQYANDNTHFLQDAFEDINDLLVKIKSFIAQARKRPVDEAMLEELEFALEQADIEFLIDEIPLAIEHTLEGLGRITKIVNAMKAFSHPGYEKKAPADIHKAIESTIIVTRNEWKYAATLSCDFDPNLHEVLCYEAEFNQVILNLIINAVHAIQDANKKLGRKKGEIEISTRKKEGFAEIRIKDTGTGIPEGVREHIFEPFFTTKEVGIGTGQGLALAHSVIVKKHGGSLDFETEEGVGTTFIIRLPLYDSEEAGAEQNGQIDRQITGASTK